MVVKAHEWWIGLDDNTQQLLADKYYPKDDFFVTDRNSERIEKIFLKEWRSSPK